MAEENMGMEPAPGSPPPGAARLQMVGREHIDFDKVPLSKRQRAAMEKWFREHPAERSGAPEASSPKGSTNVTKELPAPRAYGEKEGGAAPPADGGAHG